MKSSINYEYADGSGNTYRLTSSSLEYAPVTPERSSSGTYSGGDPKKVGIEEPEFESLSNLLDSAINNTSAHQDAREMMTGLIVRSGPSGRTRIVLKRNSSEKTRIEEALKKLLDK